MKFSGEVGSGLFEVLRVVFGPGREGARDDVHVVVVVVVVAVAAAEVERADGVVGGVARPSQAEVHRRPGVVAGNGSVRALPAELRFRQRMIRKKDRHDLGRVGQLGKGVAVAAAGHRSVHDVQLAGSEDAVGVVVVDRLLLGVLHGEVVREVTDQLSAHRTPGRRRRRRARLGLDKPDTMNTEKVFGETGLILAAEGTLRTP